MAETDKKRIAALEGEVAALDQQVQGLWLIIRIMAQRSAGLEIDVGAIVDIAAEAAKTAGDKATARWLGELAVNIQTAPKL